MSTVACLCKNWSTDGKSSPRWLNRLMKSSLSRMAGNSSLLKKKSLEDSSLRRQKSSLRSSDRVKLMRLQLSQWRPFKQVWGLHIFNKEVSDRANYTRQQLLDKHEGFEEQFSHLCQHWEAEEQSWLYNQQQQKLGDMLEESETLRN